MISKLCSLVLLTLSLNTLAAIPSKTTTNELYKELTGEKTVIKKSVKVSSATKALTLARDSKKQGDFVLAIKRYNFILKYYPKSVEAQLALKDKSMLYAEMGLKAPAHYNQQKLKKMSAIMMKNQKTVK